MNKLTIILATRGRPHLLIPTIERTLASMSRPDTTLVVAIDHDDDATREAFFGQAWDERVIPSVMPREDTLGEKYNDRLTVAPADVYLVMVDYAPHVTPGFDLKILDAAAIFGDGIGVVYNRLANLSFPEINAVTHEWTELAGGIYPGRFPYWFVDHWLDDLAKMTGRIAYADVQIDTSRRPGTMEWREPALWGNLYDALAPERHGIARRLLANMDEPAWRKAMLTSCWPMIDQRSRMINDNCRNMTGHDLPHDERYLRVRNAAVPIVNRYIAGQNAAKLDQPHGQQNEQEIGWLLESVRGAKSVLEIGSCFGRNLEHFAKVLAPGAVLRSLDLGQNDRFLPGVDTTASLERVIANLNADGFDAACLIADSNSSEAIRWAEDQGPFDLVFVDGDHTYSGVKWDWINYGTLGKVVAFHDIEHPDHGVSELWAEIKASGYQVHECVRSQMGIGVVVMPARATVEQRKTA